MRTMPVVAIFLLAAAFPALAQEGEPPKELERFDVLLGNWDGKGKMIQSEGGLEIEWTAALTATRILDGNFLQVDERIDFGAMNPAPLVFRTIYGFDRETKRFTYFGVSNAGGASHGNMFWTGAGKLVSTSILTEGSEPISYLSVTNFSESGHSFTIKKVEGGGKIFVNVLGSYKRGKNSFSAESVSDEFMPVPVEMDRVKPMLGSWSIKGSVYPMPGGPAMAISGREEITKIFGGHVLMARIEGDPVPGMKSSFRGIGFLVWDDQEKSFVNYSMTSMGRAVMEKGFVLQGNKVVFVSAPVIQGIPHTERCIVEIAADGSTMHISGDRCAGVEEADKAYETTLTRVGK